MRIPNVALAEEARSRTELSAHAPSFQIVPGFDGEPVEIIGRDARQALDAIWCNLSDDDLRWIRSRVNAYGLASRKPAERCAVMGDGIDVVRGVVVE